jgi:predicted nucleic acid-binding protein
VRTPPNRILLDTNVYIVGAATNSGPEAKILDWLGFFEELENPPPVEVVASDALFRQIRRVARRVQNKDWGGKLLANIWQHLSVRYVMLDSSESLNLHTPIVIPREDIEIYLTARAGQTECLVSANREFIRALAAETGAFECLTPEAFVAKYLST